MNKAIVTGSTGLVGTAVSKYLSDLGVQVLCLGRKAMNANQVDQTLGVNSTYLPLHMKDIESLPERALAIGWSTEPDTVFFNFAWSGRQRLYDGDLSDQLSNAIYSAQSVKIAKEMGCTKFVNSGTMEESFITKFLIARDKGPYDSSQTNYGLAKLSSRDMCNIMSYLQGIDYIHTRMSVPLASDLSNGTYVSLTLNKILKCECYDKPRSEYLYDIVLLSEVAISYYLIGSKGLNKADYFIGTGRPATLQTYFDSFLQLVNGECFTSMQSFNVQNSLFSTQSLKNDIGFVPSLGLDKVVSMHC